MSIAPILRVTWRRRWSWHRPTLIRSPASWHRYRATRRDLCSKKETDTCISKVDKVDEEWSENAVATASLWCSKEDALADVFLANKLIGNRPQAFTFYVRLVHVRKHFLGHIELLALRDNAIIIRKGNCIKLIFKMCIFLIWYLVN